MNTLCIYYIATGQYKEMINNFSKNIHLFMPNLEKTVVILSDGLKEWDGRIINGVKYKLFFINHYSWPIITLFKMHHIYNHIQNSDFVCYMNANLTMNEKYKYDYNEIIKDFSKITLVRHAYHNDTVYDGFLYAKSENECTRAYISKECKYTYVHAAFFFGPKNMILDMCFDIMEMVDKDLKVNKIPKYHDESYLNKWALSNQDKISIEDSIIYYKENNSFPIIYNKKNKIT